MRTYFDSSVVVAALLPRHPSHEPAIRWLERAAAGADRGAIAAHGLAELYAVLTALPARPRIGPEDARRLLRESVEAYLRVEPLPSAAYRAVLDRMAKSGHTGGAVYDALHIEAARRFRAERILTLNAADFARLAPERAAVIAPP